MRQHIGAIAAALIAALIAGALPRAAQAQAASGELTALSRERLVLQTQYGDLHLAFYPNASLLAMQSTRGACMSLQRP